MQWVVGQEYRTRDGKVAVIIEIMPDGMMFGRVQWRKSGCWSANAWQRDGADNADDRDFDLLPPRPPVDVSDSVFDAWVSVYNAGPVSRQCSCAALAAAIEAYLKEQESA